MKNFTAYKIQNIFSKKNSKQFQDFKIMQPDAKIIKYHASIYKKT